MVQGLVAKVGQKRSAFYNRAFLPLSVTPLPRGVPSSRVPNVYQVHETYRPDEVVMVRGIYRPTIPREPPTPEESPHNWPEGHRREVDWLRSRRCPPVWLRCRCPSVGRPGRDQTVTGPPHGLHHRWAARAVEFAAQVADVDVDDVAARVEVHVPDVVEDLRPRQHLMVCAGPAGRRGRRSARPAHMLPMRRGRDRRRRIRRCQAPSEAIPMRWPWRRRCGAAAREAPTHRCRGGSGMISRRCDASARNRPPNSSAELRKP